MIDYDQHILEDRPLSGRIPYWAYHPTLDAMWPASDPSFMLVMDTIRSPLVSREVATQPSARVDWNRAHGIDEAWVFPTAGLHSNRVARPGTPEEVDYCLTYEHAFGLAWRIPGLRMVRLLPGHPAAARVVVENSRIDEERPIWLLPSEPSVPYSMLDVWSQVWARLGAATLAFHVQHGGRVAPWPQHPVAAGLAFERETQAAVVDLVLSGVFARHGALDCLVAEVGSLWWDELKVVAGSAVDPGCGATRVLESLEAGGRIHTTVMRPGRTAVEVLGSDCPHRVMVEVDGGEQEQAARDEGREDLARPVPRDGVDG